MKTCSYCGQENEESLTVCGGCGTELIAARPLHSIFKIFAPRSKLPASFDRWEEVDIITSSENLPSGPHISEIRTLAQWLDAYGRWRGCHDEFLKAEQTIPVDGKLIDEFDKRQHEHYSALFLQSGQWHAVLLMLLEEITEAERSRYIAEIDGILAELRRNIARTHPSPARDASARQSSISESRVNNFTDTLRAVGKKPGFYLCPDRQGNSKSLSHLRTFILGMEVGQTVEFDHAALDGFTEWICLKYQVPMSGMDGLGRILERAGHDETAGFKLFFEEFEEFLKERESIGTEAIKLRYQSWEKQWWLREDSDE